MPITKQVIKRMKQSNAARTRNKHYASRMKSLIKLVLTYVQKGEMDKAKKVLPEAMKSIDTAAKKNIIHNNNASHKKSRVQRAVNNGPAKKVEKAPAKAKKAEPKKTEVKAEAKKVEEKKEATKEAK